MFCYVNKLNRPWTLKSGGSPINNHVFADVAVFQASISKVFSTWPCFRPPDKTLRPTASQKTAANG